MRVKWKAYVGVLLLIALVGIIRYTTVSYNKESPNWNESSPDTSARSIILSFALGLLMPGEFVSENWELIRGVSHSGINAFEEIFSDIFWTLLIAVVIWKFRSKPPKLV